MIKRNFLNGTIFVRSFYEMKHFLLPVFYFFFIFYKENLFLVSARRSIRGNIWKIIKTIERNGTLTLALFNWTILLDEGSTRLGPVVNRLVVGACTAAGCTLASRKREIIQAFPRCTLGNDSRRTTPSARANSLSLSLSLPTNDENPPFEGTCTRASLPWHKNTILSTEHSLSRFVKSNCFHLIRRSLYFLSFTKNFLVYSKENEIS